MSDSEKLMALKKAYADIILNTAKEAAARIMASERKAIRYQNELFAAKEEALRMLSRLKETLDAKVTEAQVASLCQRQKIEELEAQLGEAEDIVKDLRAELREAQEELETAMKNQMQLANGQHLNNDLVVPVTHYLENNPTSEIVVSSAPAAQSEMVSTSDIHLTLNGMNNSNKCDAEDGSHKDNCLFCNSDFASIVMRRKEPKLYRNGCTQRIRAYGRNLIDGNNFTLPEQIDDVKSAASVGGDEVSLRKDLDTQPDEMCNLEKNPSEVKLTQEDSNFDTVVNSFRKRKRRRRTPVKVVKINQEPDLSCPETFTAVVSDDILEESNVSAENKAEKDQESSLILKQSLDTNNSQSDCEEVTGSDVMFLKACSARGTTEDKKSVDTLDLARQESGIAQISKVSACKTGPVVSNVSTEHSDAKEATSAGLLPTQSSHDKFIKYTFQRKRKKELVSSSTDGDSSLSESVAKRKIEVKQNENLELENSSSITESPQDDRRLVQVAHELISLSEKKPLA